jgi:hypothetical protein
VWSGHLTRARQPARTSRFSLPPGETVVGFFTPLPPGTPGTADNRSLSFLVLDLQIVLRREPE